MPPPDLHDPVNRRRSLVFEVVNAASWSGVVGAPILLLLKDLGASGTVIGIALALMPLTQALQLVGARLLPRWGHRGMMVRGWTLRTVLVGLIALVALAVPWTGPGLAMWLVLVLLAGWTVLRGITSCAWMPWISQLVPEAVRGRYLAWATALIQLTLIVCNLAYAAWLGQVPGALGCAAIFAWACATGFAAAWAMSRIPDAPVEADPVGGPVPWRDMLAYRPFARLLRLTIVAHLGFAALAVLWIPVLRDLHGCSDGFIAQLPVWASCAQLAVLPLVGPLVDRVGSRPVLAAALAVMAVHTVLWGGLAAGLLPLNWITLGAIQATAGLGIAAFSVANARLLMGVVPGQGRSHFFALHSVALALGQGLGPLAWGVLLDLAPPGIAWHGWLYAAASVIILASVAMAGRLEEPRALGTAEFLRDLLVATPRRALARLAGLFDARG